MTTTLKNRLRRNRRWHNLPQHFTASMKGGVLLALTLLEGWMLSFAVTHDRLPSPLGTGTPQWAITGATLLACLIPLAWLLVVLLDTSDGE
ncbi:hypothetical protein [Bifidobacterium parmae]|uniref:Uncharacterized protein n=1 Tax=Bifidobacterium parmae TaxID=361854 RepID=A0A2N5IVL4_9BIFI|nr:hypothetical protein [Bifidobacterium parmae]PLS26005.1 hypothetical protein Uis4E_2180 [Bifidobacterium parmae]